MPVYLGVCGCCDKCCQPDDLFCDSFDTEPYQLRGVLKRWDILAGAIDTHGAGTPYDLLPGHGIYVDLAGSGGGSLDGTIRTKNAISVPAGDYALSLLLAGNQRQNISPLNVSIKFGPIDTVVSITNYLMPFTVYSYPVTGPFSDQITIQQLAGPPGRIAFYGTLLDCVRVHAAPTP